MLPQVLADEELIHMMVLTERLQKAGIEIHTGVTVTDLSERSVTCKDAEGQRLEIETDTVVVCTGLSARGEEARSFEGAAAEVLLIGDCVKPRDIGAAFADAHRAVLGIDQQA